MVHLPGPQAPVLLPAAQALEALGPPVRVPELEPVLVWQEPAGVR